MAVMISTPRWMIIPEDQKSAVRHFVASVRFKEQFGNVAEAVVNEVNNNTWISRGGLVGEFSFQLPGRDGHQHELFAESFFNQHYIITLLVSIDHRKHIIRSL